MKHTGTPAGLHITPGDLLEWRRSVGGGAGRVAVIGGTYHILHPGNITALRLAKRATGHVCVILESGNAQQGQSFGRPHVSLTERLEMVSHLKDVDVVTSCTTDTTAQELLAGVAPFTWFSCTGQIDGPLAKSAATSASRHVTMPVLPGCFTTDILDAIRSGATPIRLPGTFRGRRNALVARSRKHRLVTVNGCFDVLHIGHLRFLAQARALGDELVVLVNNDASVRRYKGNDRPVFPLRFRITALLALKSVSAVRSFHDDNPLRLIAELRPDIHVKGGSYEPARVDAERRLLESWGGQLEFCPMVEGRSTSSYLGKVGDRRAATEP